MTAVKVPINMGTNTTKRITINLILCTKPTNTNHISRCVRAHVHISAVERQCDIAGSWVPAYEAHSTAANIPSGPVPSFKQQKQQWYNTNKYAYF